MASAFGHFNCYYINRYVKWQSKCRNTYIDVSIVFLRNAYAHHSLFMTFINENRHFMKKLNFWFVIMSARSNKTFCQEFISSIITLMKWRNKKSFINVIKFNFIYVTLHSWIVCIIVEMNRKKNVYKYLSELRLDIENIMLHATCCHQRQNVCLHFKYQNSLSFNCFLKYSDNIESN